MLYFSRIFRPALALLIMLLVTGCVRATIAWADLTPDRPVAKPEALGPFADDGPVETVQDWQQSRVPALRTAFQEYVYGYLPDVSSASVLDRRVVSEAFLDGRARLEEWTVEVMAGFGDVAPSAGEFKLLLALPLQTRGPAPLILMETFCRNHNTIPHEGVTRPAGQSGCDGSGPVAMAMNYVFGRYIATPPLEEIFDRGFALATFYPGDFVPDRADAGLSALRRMSEGHVNDRTRWGAVAAWAWGFSRALDVLEEDPRIDAERTVLYGHSRYGKAALVSAAYDARVEGVISHQSGAGGGSLSRDKAGETVGDITEVYPHWFSEAYAEYAGREQELPVDQHQLLALVAPRPVLLGNARRDVWSDPEGSFMAALGADSVYELLGVDGLKQDSLHDFIPSAELSFLVRPGTHGVTEDDWPAFFDFLAAHFGG